MQDVARLIEFYKSPLGRIVRALVRAGYRSAVTTQDHLNHLGGDPFRLRRKTIWENHSRGLGGAFSPALLGCQLDGVFGMLGLQQAVVGERSGAEGEGGPSVESRA